MPFVAVPQTARIAIEGLAGPGAQPIANVFHARYTGGPLSVGDCTTLATTFLSAWVAAFIPLLSSGYEVVDANVKDLSSVFGNSAFDSSLTLGADVATPLPYAPAAKIDWLTGLTGKPFRFSSFIAPFTTDALDPTTGGRWLPAFFTALEVAAFNFLADTALIALSGGIAGLAGATTKSAHVAPSSYYIINSEVEPDAHTQRRRAGNG